MANLFRGLATVVRVAIRASTLLALSISLLLTACGGGGHSGGSTPTPTPTPSTANEWTWMNGSSTVNANGVYGTQGVASTSNVPGARVMSVSWADSNGNLWVFGGSGHDSTGTEGAINDLWKFNPTTREWTWMSGSNSVFATGVYGTQGVASASNVPGGRQNLVSWIDNRGNLWLFGRLVFTPMADGLNDLWEFDSTTKEWTWVSGSKSVNTAGVYGSQGVASASNVPGARFESVSWVDRQGNFWLFGGSGWIQPVIRAISTIYGNTTQRPRPEPG